MFAQPLHVGRPNIGDRAKLAERIDGALDRHYLSNGPLVRAFEQALCEVVGTRHAIAVSNATVGLQIAVRALGVNPGDEVIVPTFTAPATAHALSWIGIDPVFADVEEATGNVDPTQVEKLISPRTKAVVGVHVFGRACAIDELTEIGSRHSVPVLFDAAHGIGCTYRGKQVGGFGAAEIFSFHATKYVNSFDGGAIVTDDDDYAYMVRAMRNYGMAADRETYSRDAVVSVGTNAKMSEPNAAMGVTSLEAMAGFAEINKRNYHAYREGLEGVRGVRVMAQDETEAANYQYVVITVDPDLAGADRETVYATLTAENVLVRRYFFPNCHQIVPYRDRPDVHMPLPLPRAETLTEQVIALPTGTAIGPAEVAGVCAIIRRAVGR